MTYQEARDRLAQIVREVEVCDINLCRLNGCIETENATRALLVRSYARLMPLVNLMEEEALANDQQQA